MLVKHRVRFLPVWYRVEKTNPGGVLGYECRRPGGALRSESGLLFALWCSTHYSPGQGPGGGFMTSQGSRYPDSSAQVVASLIAETTLE